MKNSKLMMNTAISVCFAVTSLFCGLTVARAQEPDNRIDWRWGRPGVMVVTNAPTAVTVTNIATDVASGVANTMFGPRITALEGALDGGTNNWDTAYGWGDHALAGYLLPADLAPYATTASLAVHTNRTDNPHNVTAAQIGALTAELDPVANAKLVIHTNRIDNPHSVTAAQIGALTAELDPVANASLAVHTNRTDNPHNVTAAQIGALTAELDPVANAALAVHTNRADNPHGVTAVQIGALTAEVDPVAGPRLDLIEPETNKWNAAYAWGDHALAGYLLPADLAPYATTQQVAAAVAPLATTQQVVSLTQRVTGLEGSSNDWSKTVSNLAALSNNVANLSSCVDATNNLFSAWFSGLQSRTSYWDTAYSWGDHALAGYLLPADLAPYATTAALAVHTNRADNPHGVTAAQVGAITNELDLVALAADRFLPIDAGKNVISTDAGSGSIVTYSTLIGDRAGNSITGANVVAIGRDAARKAILATGEEEADVIAIGENAAEEAGQLYAVSNVIAIGDSAFKGASGARAIAIGDDAGFAADMQYGIAVGQFAGYGATLVNSIVIGTGAGSQSSLTNSVAIGTSAGEKATGAGMLFIDSSGTGVADHPEYAMIYGSDVNLTLGKGGDAWPYSTNVLRGNWLFNNNQILTNELDPVANAALAIHTNRADNPHGVTAPQIGALTEELDPVANAALAVHTNRTDNPHGVTAAQTGALAALAQYSATNKTATIWNTDRTQWETWEASNAVTRYSVSVISNFTVTTTADFNYEDVGFLGSITSPFPFTDGAWTGGFVDGVPRITVSGGGKYWRPDPWSGYPSTLTGNATFLHGTAVVSLDVSFVTNSVRYYLTTGNVWQAVASLQGSADDAMRLYHYGSPDIHESPAEWFTFDGTGTITAFSYSVGRENVVIPWEIGGVAVTAIGGGAFGESGIVSVIAPQTVTVIGDYAFYACTSLTSVSLPQATAIGGYAFYACTSLTSVSLPQATAIGDYAFGNCGLLTSVRMGQNAPAEAADVFYGIPLPPNVYVTNPQATGWGAVWNGAPVVRPPLYAEAIYQAGELVATTGHVAQAIAAIPQPDLSDRPTFAQIAASNALPYTAWTGTVTPQNGTATVAYAHGNMPVLVTDAPCVLTLDPTGYGTAGVSRVSLSYYTGTNSFTFATNIIDYAATPTVDTNGWNTLLIRRVSDGRWKGVGL